MDKKRKRDSWDVAETEYFLDLVQERKILKSLDGKRFRAEDIFFHLQVPMQNRGYVKTGKQMQMRFKTLRTQYNQCKRLLGKSGSGNCRSKFIYYEKMAKLLGDRPIAMQEGMDSTQCSDSVLEDIIDEGMYDNLPDERDGAIPGGSGGDTGTCTPYQEESEQVSNSYEESESTSTSAQQDSDSTLSNSQRSIPCNSRSVMRSRRGGRSFQNLIYNYANIAKENAKELQNELLHTQQTFLNNLIREQQDFEEKLMQKMLQGQKQIMNEMTNQLLSGLRNISGPPVSPIRVSSPMSSPDSFYRSSSLSPTRPIRSYTPPPLWFGSTATTKPVRLILRPSSALSSPIVSPIPTPLPPSFRSVRASGPFPVHTTTRPAVPVSDTQINPAVSASSINISQHQSMNSLVSITPKPNQSINTAIHLPTQLSPDFEIPTTET